MWWAAALALWVRAAPADVPPPGVRGVEYELTIENLQAYPDRVFFVYPTTNAGYAYRLERGKGLTSLMVNGRHGATTELFAVGRAAFAKAVPKPETYPHGDKEAMVQVFAPPPNAPKANLPIAPPAPVPESSPIRKVERVLRVTKVTDDTLELALVRQEAIMKDGSRAPLPEAPSPTPSASVTASAPPARSTAPAAPSADAEPKRAGCSGCSAGGGQGSYGVLPLLALAIVLQRRLARASVPATAARKRQ